MGADNRLDLFQCPVGVLIGDVEREKFLADQVSQPGIVLTLLQKLEEQRDCLVRFADQREAIGQLLTAERSLKPEGGGFLETATQPVDDLVARGASEARCAAELARECEVVFLCLPSSVEVEAIVYAADGLKAGARPGLVVVDSTTADPDVTRRIAADLSTVEVEMIDAPLGRTPKEAEEGKLSTYVGGNVDVIRRVRPLLECYADTIVETGAIGSGTTCKLVNNFISIGTSAVIAEAIATAAKLGVDLQKLYDVVSAGGANSAMFQMVMPWVLEGDDGKLKGPIRIAAKDLRFYARMAQNAQATAFIAQACSQTYELARILGHSERYMPVLPGILAELNGAPIRALDEAP
ncbi:MAG TPA: NAD(P)-dependent oxidoreductase [Verrucomicrobiales bacterium]|nr:NAD(P)-dependent oxidoreductase [Verrucomicrobiales bacterium]